MIIIEILKYNLVENIPENLPLYYFNSYDVATPYLTDINTYTIKITPYAAIIKEINAYH